MSKTRAIVAAAGVAAGLAAPATAEVIMSFGFTDLSASYSTDDGAFRAVSANDGELRSSGDVTRLVGPFGTATYGPGSAPGAVVFEISVENIGGGMADGSGDFTITDDNGDTLTGLISGKWIDGGNGIAFFTGYLSDVFLNDNSQDATFNGPTSGSFSMDFAAEAPYSGAFIQLFFNFGGGFFNKDFSRVSSQVAGEIIPAPASAALMMLGMGIAFRRRRNA